MRDLDGAALHPWQDLNMLLGSLRAFFGLGTDPLHDAGVVLSLLVLAGGPVALVARTRAALLRKPVLASLQILRMVAVLRALGGLMAYLREFSFSHGLQDLTMGGLAALPWVAIVILEMIRRSGLN